MKRFLLHCMSPVVALGGRSRMSAFTESLGG